MNARPPRERVSRSARESSGVRGSRRRMPRVSAMTTFGQAPRSPRSVRTSPTVVRHHVSTLGVADVSQSASFSRRARSNTMSRACRRGWPGGRCASSCSSMSTSVGKLATGASNAPRVPTPSRIRPVSSARQADARSASATSESSRATGPIFPSRCAHRAEVSTSLVRTSTGPSSAAMRSSTLRSRPAPVSSSGRGPAAVAATPYR